MAAKGRTEHQWMSLDEAGTYANIHPDVLKGAIIRDELVAYEKPVTRGRTGATRKNVLLRISRDDVDEYIRTHWRRADASTFGMAASVADIA